MIALAAQLAETRWLGEISYCDIACSIYLILYPCIPKNNWLLIIKSAISFEIIKTRCRITMSTRKHGKTEINKKVVQLFATAASATADFFFLIPRRLSDGYSQRNERL